MLQVPLLVDLVKLGVGLGDSTVTYKVKIESVAELCLLINRKSLCH
jgi:hypothetical protein